MPERIGRVIQMSGPAVDVQFVEGAMPPIYQALKVVSDGFKVPNPVGVILEVQQHLGEGRVRAVSPANRSDGFLGSDMSQDDGPFFDGKPEDFEWKLVGKRDGLRIVDPGAVG